MNRRDANVRRFGFPEPRNVLMLLAMLPLACLETSVASGQVHDETPMELSGLSVSQAFDVPDDQPLDLNQPLIKKLLYRIKKASPQSRWKYSQYSKDLTWDDIVLRTEDHRLWTFRFPARLKRVQKFTFPDALPDAEIKGVYRCECENEDGNPFIALTRALPGTFEFDQPLDQPIQITGFLLARASRSKDKESQEIGGETVPVFIVDRLGWFPENPTQGATQSHVELAKHGVDIGLLDLVRESNAKSLGPADSEAFFQMISGIGAMETPVTIKRIGLSDLGKDATSKTGNAIQIQGLVRSCVKIQVTDPDIQQRIGLADYYQLIVFPDLNGGKILIEDKSGDVQEFERYPITVCCTELPSGMTPADIERKPILVDGFFFRFWKYQSEKTDLAGKPGLASPLIIAKFLTPVDLQADRLDFILLIFAAVVIAGIAVLLWSFRNSDKNREIRGESLLDSLPDQIDVTGIKE